VRPTALQAQGHDTNTDDADGKLDSREGSLAAETSLTHHPHSDADLEPGADGSPVEHVVQAAAPTESLYVPAAHSAHEVAVPK
jgi:hypothetical protein